MLALPFDCIKHIASFCPPSTIDQLLELTILTMDDIISCTQCNVRVALWQGYCEACFLYHSCLECGMIRSVPRYQQLVGIGTIMDGICALCIHVPHFTCFFCHTLFFALDGHRIRIACDQSVFEHVCCKQCVPTMFSTTRVDGQWVECHVKQTSYGAKLWYGPPLEFHYGGTDHDRLLEHNMMKHRERLRITHSIDTRSTITPSQM